MRWADDAQIGEKNAGATIYVVDTAQYPEDTLRFMVEGETTPRVSIGANGITTRGIATAPITNGTDDTAALQAFLDAQPTGTMVLFPTTTYQLSASLLLPERLMYVGPMTHVGVTFTQKSGSNLSTPILCSKNWYNNLGASNGIWIERLNVDGNKAGNGSATTACHGILICGWESMIRNCHVRNTPGSGIVLTDASRNGVAIAGTAVENRVMENTIEAPEGHGIYVWEQSGSGKITDGFCVDNILYSVMLHGVYLQRGAGWRVSGNHTYSSAGRGKMGIWVDNCFDTRITDNYVDNYGQANEASSFWSGIRAELSSGGGSIPVGSTIANNTIRCSADNASGSTTYRHLYVICKATLTSSAAVTGNVVNGNNGANEVGLRCEAAATATFDLACTGNQVSYVATAGNRFQFVKTGTAISGQIDVYGSGTPEANITAPVGSTYRRTDGGAATCLYIKESGTGNTGWVAK